MKNKFFVFFTIACLSLTGSIPVYAIQEYDLEINELTDINVKYPSELDSSTDITPDSVIAKKELVKEAKEYKKEKGFKKTLTKEEGIKLYKEYKAGKNNLTLEDFKEYGMFFLDVPVEQTDIVLNSVAGDVSLDSVRVIYWESDGTWTLSAGGKWNNDNWKEGFNPYGSGIEKKEEKDIGGPDAVGITLYDTNSAPSNLQVIGTSYIWAECKDTDKHVMCSTLENTDIENGVVYHFQDKYIWEDKFIGVKNEDYIGYEFDIIVNYNSAFENYSGKARFFYVHTWDKTKITGITLGTKSIGVTFSTNKHSWIGYSTTYTEF